MPPAAASPFTDERPVLVAPDAFKGTLRASEVAAAIGRGLERVLPVAPDLMPVADGGEGTMEVLLLALGGESGGAAVTGPLGDPVTAGFGLLEQGGAAIVEVAQASGLTLVPAEQRDAERASSAGTGELIAAAIDAGAEVVLVAAGGSAMTDGGAGAVAALEERGGLRGAALVVLCDVRTPWEAAAARFGPQKGADAAAVKRLRTRLEQLATTLPRDPRGVPMSGAAGGLAGGLWAHYGAELRPGARFVIDALDAGPRMRAARALVVGEGRLDPTTLEGKIAGELATDARQSGVPCHAIVGEDALGLFERRIIDLQTVRVAGTIKALETAGERLGAEL